MEKQPGYNLNDFKNRYYNESLADLVKNVSEKERIIEYKGQLYQQINPIFLDPIPNGYYWTTVLIFSRLKRICLEQR